MDIFAHALWTNLVYYKKYRNDLKDRLWAVFFGIAPDLVSFIPATIYAFFHFGNNQLMALSSSNLWVFTWARESYNYTHSLVIMLFVMAVVTLVRKGKPYWPLLGWALHIVIDIFTHHNFYQTPFLFPISGFKNNFSISWGEPIFMLINYICIIIFYTLIVTVWSVKMSKNKAKREFVVIAHNMRSLYNVGSMFRTADAFNVTKIYLTGYTGTPANPLHKIKISKSALGAESWVPWEHKFSATRLIKDLKLKKFNIVALEKTKSAQNIKKFKPKFPLALVLGEEVRGVSKAMLKLCDSAIEIPMLGKKESLNVSVAFGIAGYEISK